MAIETGLEGKPWYVAGAVAAGLAGALVFGVYSLKIKDLNLRIAAQNRQLGELQKKIEEGRSAQRSLPAFREEVQRLELELEKLLRILPTKKYMEDLLRRLRTLTEQGNLELLRVAPKTPQPQDFYSVWQMEIELAGTYHNLALLFDRVGRFSRIINVENLTIDPLSARAAVGRNIRAKFTAKTFLYTPQEEAPAAKPGPPPRGGKR